MAFKIKINGSVTWVGKVDWELRSFHGEELSTHRGTSYNSYLIRDEKGPRHGGTLPNLKS